MPAIVQKKYTYTRVSGPNFTVTLDSSPSAGNTLIVISFGNNNSNLAISLPTSPPGWTQDGFQAASGGEASAIIVGHRTVQSGDGNTLTLSGTAQFPQDVFVAVWEIHGVQPIVAGVGSPSTAPNNEIFTPVITPPNSSMVGIMFGYAQSATFGTLSPSPPYEIVNSGTGGSPVSAAMVDADGTGLPASSVSLGFTGSGGARFYAFATAPAAQPAPIISLSVQPGFFDISDAVLGCDQPLADYDLIKISYNSKLAVCRPEAFFMGYYTDGNTLPVPVSPLDAYAYNLTESLYFFQLASTKPPMPGFSPGQETFPALDFTGQPVEGFLCDPYQLEPNFGTLTQAGFSTEKQITLKSLFYEHGSVGDNVPQQPYSAGAIAAYCFGQRQSATMSPILPGSSYQTNFQPVFYDFPDAAIFDGAPITQQMLQAISRNAKLGIFRFDLFFMGYYRNGDIVPTPFGAGNYAYARNECIFMPMLGSSRQPTGDFVPEQVYFPPLANLDVYQFPANALPEQLYIDPSTGQVTCSINGANGPQGQGSVAVYCFAQRYPNLTMSAQPTFTDIPDTAMVGGQVPTAALLQQLNNNAKFGIVATEAFFAGYFENGDTIPTPTSPVDGYTYANHETLFIPVWVSSHKASGLTPGQKTWPAFGPDQWTPTSNTTLVASPYKCFVNQFTAPYGQLTASLYGAGNGITNQGIVAAYAIGSRQQNITGTTL